MPDLTRLSAILLYCLFLHRASSQEPGRALTDLNTSIHKLLLHGVTPHQPLFEKIAPLDGLHVLHQAVAIPKAGELDLLHHAVTPPPLFNPNQRFLTVTVPNPLFNVRPVTLMPPQIIVNENTPDLLTEVPKALGAGILNPPAPTPKSDEEEKVAKNDGIELEKLNTELEAIEKQAYTEIPTTTTQQLLTTTPPTPSTTKDTAEQVSVESSIPETDNDKQSPHPIDLARHLNSSNIEKFLSKTNISTQEAQSFLKLVEKVLEEEVAERVHLHENDAQAQAAASSQTPKNESFKQALDKLSPDDIEPSLDTSSHVDKYGDDYEANDNNARHELKTGDTRLSYNAELRTTDDSKGLTRVRINPLESHPRMHIVGGSTDHSASPRIFSTTNLDINKIHATSDQKSPSVVTDHYRVREQAAFDRLIKEYKNDVTRPASGKTLSAEGKATTPVPATTTKKIIRTVTKAPQIPHRMTTRHPIHTRFEMLAEDYRYRLSATNGIDDLFKALKNANIGIFERPTYHRYAKPN